MLTMQNKISYIIDSSTVGHSKTKKKKTFKSNSNSNPGKKIKKVFPFCQIATNLMVSQVFLRMEKVVPHVEGTPWKSISLDNLKAQVGTYC